MHDTGLRVGGILVDAGYSLSALFRHTPTELGLIWVVVPLAGHMSIRPILRWASRILIAHHNARTMYPAPRPVLVQPPDCPDKTLGRVSARAGLQR